MPRPAFVLLLLLAGGACHAPVRPADEARPERPASAGPVDAKGETPDSLRPDDYPRLQNPMFRRRIDPGRLDEALLTAAVYYESNRRRAGQGVRLLEAHPLLDRAAREHARAMVREGFFDHTHPTDPARRTPADRVGRLGLEPGYVAENIARTFVPVYESGRRVYVREEDGVRRYSYTPDGPLIPDHTYRSFAVALLDLWMNSPGHRQNLLSAEPAFLGCGCAPAPDPGGMDELYCVQIFFKGG